MSEKTESQILTELIALTHATPVPPSEVEMQEWRELEERKERGRKDAELSRQVRAKQRREKEMLEQARAQIGVGV